MLQVHYEQVGEGKLKVWVYREMPKVLPPPMRNSAERNVSFHDNPGPIIDERAIEFELNRPHMPKNVPEEERTDLRNKDVVSFNDVLSFLYACNNNVVALAAAASAKAVMYYLVNYLLKNGDALSNCLSIIHEAKDHAKKYPSTAEPVGRMERPAIQILQRTLNSIIGTNSEVSGSLAAFALMGLPDMMTSRKFWFCFIFPAVSFMASRFPAEVGLSHQVKKSDDDETDAESSDDEDEDSADEAASGGGDEADDMQIQSSANGFKAAAADTATSSTQPSASSSSTTAPRKTQRKAASENHKSQVLDFSHNAQCAEAAEDGRPVADLVRVPGGKFITVEQHDHYKHRGPHFHPMNFDEYCPLVVIVPIPKEGAASKTDAPDDAEVDDGDSKEEDETSASSAADSTPRIRGHGKNGARTRNGAFAFAKEHPLSETHQQRLRSDPRISVLAGRAPTPFPGPRVDTPAWRKRAHAFAVYMITLLCPWNLTTYHPERFDEATGAWVPVELSWEGLCTYIELLHDREDRIQREADSKSSVVHSADGKEKVAHLEPYVDDAPYLTARLVRFRNIMSNFRTTVGVRNSNVWFRNRGTTHWNAKEQTAADAAEARENGTYVPNPEDEEIQRQAQAAVDSMLADAAKFDDTNSSANKLMRSNADAVQVVTTLFNANSSVAAQPAEAAKPRRSKCITATAMNSLTLLMKSQTLSSDEDAVKAGVAAEKGQGADYVAGVDLPGSAAYAIDPNAPACNEEQEAALQKMLRWLQIAHQAKQPGASQSFLEPAPLWLLHGPGGCGKSFFANKLVEAARAHTKQRGCVRGCAPTGEYLKPDVRMLMTFQQ